MSTHLVALPAPRIAPQLHNLHASVADPLSFFRYHGAWALGVRLFRSIRFRAKALIIVTVMLVPMLFLTWNVWHTQAVTINTLTKERAGVEAMQALVPVLQGILAARNATRAGLGGYAANGDYQQARADTDKALAALQVTLKKSNDVLPLQSSLEKLTLAWQATNTATNGVDASGRTVFGPVAKAFVEFLNKLADDANLTLDSDVDSLYMVNALILALPKTIEDVGQLWGWGTYALMKGPLTGKEQEKFVLWSGRAEGGIEETRAFLERSISASPILKSKIDFSALEAIEAFRHKANETAAGKGDAKAFFEEGRQAVARIAAMYSKTLPVLDEILVGRLQQANNERIVLCVLIVSALVLVGYLFYAFFLVMNMGLLEVKKHLEAISEGDLTTSPTPWGKDEVADLLHTLTGTQTSLRRIVTQVRNTSESIVQASTEIASASSDLSSRTEQSAANLEESASSIEEVSATVKSTADNAQQAATLANANTAVALHGGEVITEVVNTMEAINASSNKIRDIIGTIDGIAFQTNILALNAAVEAARAGEQGRGFAVVAAEVRSLAQRSAEAAKEIKSLISASVEQVGSGTTVVKGAGDTMTEIVNSAKRMSSLLGEISTASAEQSSGISQVSQSVQEMDRMTQQNAALVEETAAAALSLKEQALSLVRDVSQFRLA